MVSSVFSVKKTEQPQSIAPKKTNSNNQQSKVSEIFTNPTPQAQSVNVPKTPEVTKKSGGGSGGSSKVSEIFTNPTPQAQSVNVPVVKKSTSIDLGKNIVDNSSRVLDISSGMDIAKNKREQILRDNYTSDFLREYNRSNEGIQNRTEFGDSVRAYLALQKIQKKFKKNINYSDLNPDYDPLRITAVQDKMKPNTPYLSPFESNANLGTSQKAGFEISPSGEILPISIIQDTNQAISQKVPEQKSEERYNASPEQLRGGVLKETAPISDNLVLGDIFSFAGNALTGFQGGIAVQKNKEKVLKETLPQFFESPFGQATEISFNIIPATAIFGKTVKGAEIAYGSYKVAKAAGAAEKVASVAERAKVLAPLIGNLALDLGKQAGKQVAIGVATRGAEEVLLKTTKSGKFSNKDINAATAEVYRGIEKKIGEKTKNMGIFAVVAPVNLAYGVSEFTSRPFLSGEVDKQIEAQADQRKLKGTEREKFISDVKLSLNLRSAGEAAAMTQIESISNTYGRKAALKEFSKSAEKIVPVEDASKYLFSKGVKITAPVSAVEGLTESLTQDIFRSDLNKESAGRAGLGAGLGFLVGGMFGGALGAATPVKKGATKKTQDAIQILGYAVDFPYEATGDILSVAKERVKKPTEMPAIFNFGGKSISLGVTSEKASGKTPSQDKAMKKSGMMSQSNQFSFVFDVSPSNQFNILPSYTPSNNPTDALTIFNTPSDSETMNTPVPSDTKTDTETITNTVLFGTTVPSVQPNNIPLLFPPMFPSGKGNQSQKSEKKKYLNEFEKSRQLLGGFIFGTKDNSKKPKPEPKKKKKETKKKSTPYTKSQENAILNANKAMKMFQNMIKIKK